MSYHDKPRLAELLGMPVHRSLLLRKIRSYGADTPEKLVSLAVQRGCYHYENDIKMPFVPKTVLSDEQLAVALISPNNPFHPHLVRAGAQLLSGDDVNIKMLVSEAVKERAGEVLLHIAKAGQRSEPDNPKWSQLIQLILQACRHLNQVKPGILPSDSRFRIETGFGDRKKLPRINKTWLRPIRTGS